MSETEPAESQTPRIWIETLLATEQEISDLLDEAKRLYLRGEKREVRRMLANLFEADSGVYRAITYSVSGGDDFFSDVEEQMSEETVKKVEELGQSYSLLSNEIIAVFNQNSNDTKKSLEVGCRKNTILRVKRPS